MSARRKPKATPPSHYPLYSWRADRKAAVGHIRASIARAVIDRADAVKRANDPKWMAMASILSQQWATDSAGRSVRYLARKHLEYWRLRAFMHGAYEGYPGDKPAHDHWGQFVETPP